MRVSEAWLYSTTLADFQPLMRTSKVLLQIENFAVAEFPRPRKLHDHDPAGLDSGAHLYIQWSMWNTSGTRSKRKRTSRSTPFSSPTPSACSKMNWPSRFAILIPKRKNGGSLSGWICSEDFSSWFMCGEAKQYDSFQRGTQRRANGKNTRVRALRGIHRMRKNHET